MVFEERGATLILRRRLIELNWIELLLVELVISEGIIEGCCAPEVGGGWPTKATTKGLCNPADPWNGQVVKKLHQFCFSFCFVSHKNPFASSWALSCRLKANILILNRPSLLTIPNRFFRTMSGLADDT
jgi:hypothetical protein